MSVQREDFDYWLSENADLIIESGAREEKYLLEHNSFSLKEEKQNNYVKVNVNDHEAVEYVQMIELDEEEEDDYFKPMFNNMNPLERKYYLLETSQLNGDFFYFTLC